MDFALTQEQREIRTWVRDFVARELIPLEDQVLRNERDGRPALSRTDLRDLQQVARTAGFWGLQTPLEYGGMALDAVTTALVLVELHRTFVPFQFGGSADNVLYACTPEQEQRYLIPTIEGDRVSCFAITEPGAGSDARAISMSARRDGSDWVLNGEKVFITHGMDADYALVFAVTDLDAAPGDGVTCFLVDRNMGWTSDDIAMMGEWTPASLSFQDVRVPHDNVLGEVGGGFRLAMRWIERGRLAVPAMAVGAAERLLAMAVEQANLRETFGLPLAERQAIQWMVADSATELEAARLLLLHAAWRADSTADARHHIAIAKLYGAEMANRVVDRVMQIFGGLGLTRELPIERWYRELRVLRIFDGTDEIQRRSIARDLLSGRTRVDSLTSA